MDSLPVSGRRRDPRRARFEVELDLGVLADERSTDWGLM
jgi:hypothetical protein